MANGALSKAEFKALEKVWTKEIDAALSGHGIRQFQSKAKIYDRLAEDGLVEKTTTVLPGVFRVLIVGWELTHAGRLLYCSACDRDEAP